MIKSTVGVLIGLAATAVLLFGGSSGAPAHGDEEKKAKSFVPTERIDVEQAVEFPYDI